MNNKRCLALYSGGLDSILAIKLMEELGFEVLPIFFCTPYFGFSALLDPDSFRAKHAEKFGIKPDIIDYTKDITRILKDPAHGYGKHLNPCIDCKIGMLRQTRTLLDKMDASFIITGEVLGQRPMSQRSDTMRIIEKESGLEGLLLRPLCAIYMAETLPEKLGIVNKNELWGITGRGRKEQVKRAISYGIKKEDIPNAAGGCLLADVRIARKVRRTLDRHPRELPHKADLVMDVIGREFLLDPETVLAVGRDESENNIISKFVYPKNVFLRIEDVPGPLCVLRGRDTEENLSLAAGICLRYSRAKGMTGHRAIYGPDALHMVNSIEAPVFDEEYCATFQD